VGPGQIQVRRGRLPLTACDQPEVWNWAPNPAATSARTMLIGGAPRVTMAPTVRQGALELHINAVN
jgi:hypothetical protein